MKKVLSTLLVGALVLGMAPAVFADEAAAGTTIATADEFIAMANALNDDDATNDPTGPVTVTDDLDFAGKDYTPIAKLTVDIDFGGKTVSNLDVTTDIAAVEDDHVGGDYYDNWHCTAVGLLAHYAGNGRYIKNVTIKDSSLAVTAPEGAAVDVGGVIGTSDRGYVTDINLDGVEITSNAAGNVGGLIGCYMWSYDNDADLVYTADVDVKIDAANANVGFLIGHINDDSVTFNTKDCNINAEIVASSNVITESSLWATGAAQDNTTSENVTVNLGGDGVNLEEAAIEASLETIDTPAELKLLADRLNEKGTDYKSGATIKVTADLDMSGVEYAPMVDAKFVLDFDGHTVSNLNVTTDGADMDGKKCAGLIANTLTNDPKGQVINVTLKDCELTTTAAAVGGVVGGANRGSVDNVTLENVTINATSATVAGAVMGEKWWGCAHPDMNATIKNVTINAAEATVVGILIGSMEGDAQYGAPKLNVTGVSVSGLTVVDAATPETLVGVNNVVVAEGDSKDALITYAEEVEISIDLDGDGEDDVEIDTTTPPPATGEGETPDDGEGETPDDGEGETPDDGEGETPDDGEGETPDDGEGETPDDGEGETPDDGEGETPDDGEGETPDDGKDDGKTDDGKDDGKTDDGKDDGKTDGKDDGKTDGKDDGKTDGKDDGKTDGKDDGKTDGKDDGKKDPAKTGDAMVLAVVLAVIALAGVAVISKKRSAC